jgi:hypothetical protein
MQRTRLTYAWLARALDSRHDLKGIGREDGDQQQADRLHNQQSCARRPRLCGVLRMDGASVSCGISVGN